MTPAENTEIRWLVAFLFAITAELSLTMLEGVYHDTLSVSFIFKLSVELLFWIVLYILVVVEAYRLLNWPWNFVPASVFVVNFPDLAYSFLTIQSSASASVNLYAIWSAKIALSLVVVLMYSVKAYYDSNEDSYDIHLRDRSEDFYSSPPIKTPSLPVTGFSSTANKPSVEPSKSRTGSNNSRWVNWNSKDQKNSMAESAINRNINEDHNRSQRNNRSSSGLFAAFSWMSGTTNTTISVNDHEASKRLLEDEEMQKMQPYEDHRYSSMSSASFSSNSSMGNSRALMQVMEQHRAKVTALNPILEPKGLDYYDYSTSTAKKASDFFGDSEESIFEKLRFQVLVQKWGLRNKKVPITSDKEKRSDESDGPSIENNETKTEVEFEIVVASRSGGNDRQQVDWNKANSQKANSVNRWTVWRSIDDITKLHSQMVSLHIRISS
jgi:hypothetical protein